MKKKFYLGLIFLVILYISYEVYLYNREQCNIILYVSNFSKNKPKVNIKVFISDELVVDEEFNKIESFYDKCYRINSMIGLKKIIVKIDDEIQYDGYFVLLGVRWIKVINHTGTRDQLYMVFNFERKYWL